MNKIFVYFALMFVVTLPIFAADYTNSNFILRNPAITVSGGRSTTTSFEFFSSTGQTAPGQSSNSSFTYQAGFLYFGEAAAEEEESAGPTSTSSGGSVAHANKVVFSGKAYPNSQVFLLKDAQIVKTSLADANANFKLDTSISAGDYIFSIYAKDYNGKASRLLFFPVKGVSNKDTIIEKILIPPTISKNKKEVKKGETIEIFGQTFGSTAVKIIVESTENEFFVTTNSSNDGKYRYYLNTADLDYGGYDAISEVSFNGSTISSSFINFTVGDKDFLEDNFICPDKGDLNNDCLVNLVDFSMLIYWFDKSDVPKKLDLDGDGKADLVDFSIMAYYWTG